MKQNKKFDFKNISKEDKQKYAFFGIVGIILISVLVISYGSDKKEENVDFSNPEADLIAYNNKIDAMYGKKVIDSSNDLEYTFSSSSLIKNEENITPNFEALDKQIAEIGKPKKTVNEEQYTPPPSNSHNVYGDYNMWQTNEPQKSNIGYSNTQNRPKVVKSKEINVSKQEDTEEYSETINYHPKTVQSTPKKERTNNVEDRRLMIRTGKRNVENTPNIKFNVSGDQAIKNGGTVKLKTMEDSFISNIYVPKYSVVYGRASFNEDRVYITITSFKVEDKIVHCNLEGYGTDGLQGIGVNIGSISGASQIAQQEIDRSMNLNRTRIGQIVSALFSSKNKNDIRVKLLNNHSLIFIQR